jgi:hypothetical protein
MHGTVRVFHALLNINLSCIHNFRSDRGDTNLKQEYSKCEIPAFFYQYINTTINIHHN